MSTKEALIEMIRRMPDDATTVEGMAYDLYVRARIEEGIRQADAGDVIDHEEVKKRLSRWLA